jgi:hypothetical protein
MGPWLNPSDSHRQKWAGTEPDATRPAPEMQHTVYERAVETSVPYSRRETITLKGEGVTEQFNSTEYVRAKVRYDIAVDSDHRTKIVSSGHLWGEKPTHQRYRAQYRREGPPTETVPFESYDSWMRYQTGTVERKADGDLGFDADTKPQERTRTLDWDEMYPSDRLRIIEAELVRNPGLARYRLREQDIWAEACEILRYNPDAFDIGP